MSTADLVAGAIMTVTGLAFAFAARDYEVGSLRRMGPGFFPLMVATALTGVGAAMLVKAFVAPSRIERVDVQDAGVEAVTTVESFGSLPLRPTALVLGSILWFAFTVEGFGLAPAIFGTVVLASAASTGAKWQQALLAGTLLTIASWLIFVVGLKLQAPLLGTWLGG